MESFLRRLINSQDIAGIPGTKVYKSGVDGPRAGILLFTHGDEKRGVEALAAMEEDLLYHLVEGEVTVCVNNWRAALAGQRFLEADMNRIFREGGQVFGESMEAQRARELIPAWNRMDMALDVHNVKTSIHSPFFTVLPGGSIAQGMLSQAVGPDYHVIYPPYVNGTGSVSDFFLDRGKACITLEFGTENALERGIESLRRYLQYAGVLPCELPPVRESEWLGLHQMEWTTQPRLLAYDERFVRTSFAPTQRGQVIAREGNRTFTVEEAGRVLFSKPPTAYTRSTSPLPPEEPFIYLGRRVSPLDA